MHLLLSKIEDHQTSDIRLREMMSLTIPIPLLISSFP